MDLSQLLLNDYFIGIMAVTINKKYLNFSFEKYNYWRL